MSEVVEIPVEVWEHCQRDAATIAFLHKECVRLKAEVERLRCLSDELNNTTEYLELENARLRKAGDAMSQEIIGCYRAEGYDPADSESLRAWRAAKEGRPNE